MELVKRKRGRAAVSDRARIMRRDCGVCQICKREGRLTPALEVDHIVALCNGGDDSDENKQALCLACHEAKTRADLGQKQVVEFGADGMPTTPGHHWNR